MLHKLLRLVFTLCGALFGYGMSTIITGKILPALYPAPGWDTDSIGAVAVGIFCTFLFGIIFFKLSPTFLKIVRSVTKKSDAAISKIPVNDLASGGIGLVFGLLIAYFLSQIIYRIELLQTAYLSTIISVLIYLLFAFLGINVAKKVGNEAVKIAKFRIQPQRVAALKQKRKNQSVAAAPKILDTSVIIDGRITDILKTGFIEGEIVIPDFVLVELRHIADSSDSLKRNRGRRGLDMLGRIEEDYGIKIYNTSERKSFDAAAEADVKLLRLAQEIDGMVVTNDFNLNKVAAIQGVPVLNINELANTLKPVVLPGEKMHIFLVKEGKESGQGIAYLDDGTMIVVENGKQHIGTSIDVSVTSVLQTSAGRMIFAKTEE